MNDFYRCVNDLGISFLEFKNLFFSKLPLKENEKWN